MIRWPVGRVTAGTTVSEFFPLHSDLAHWAVPPRYILLRCLVGSSNVYTHLLPGTRVIDLIGDHVLRRAVFAARKQRMGFSGLVRALASIDGYDVFRWDPVFLTPLNAQAKALASTMFDSRWDDVAEKILLDQPGDAVVIDNWRMLHGRGAASRQDCSRRIERAYFSEVCPWHQK